MNRLALAIISITGVVFFNSAYAADSTSFSNIKPTSTTSRYPAQWTNNVAYGVRDWSTLIPCPGTPGATMAVAYCPGINGTPTNPVPDVNPYTTGIATVAASSYNANASNITTSGTICLSTGGGSCSYSANINVVISQNPYCPDLCLARRAIDNTITTATTVPVTASTVTFAGCPTGYVKVAEYDFQPEIIKTSASYNIPSPITWSDHQTISGIAGASCANDFFSSPNSKVFRGCEYAGSADAARWITLNNSGLFAAAPTTIDVNNTGYGNGYAGVWWDQYVTYGSTSNATPTAIGTSGWNGVVGDNLNSGYIYVCNSGACNCQTHFANPGWVSIANTVVSPSTSYTVWLHYGYVLRNCTVPANTYVRTTKNVPSTYVCARVRGQWQNSQ